MANISKGGIRFYFAAAGLALAIPLSVMAGSGAPRGDGAPGECGHQQADRRGGEHGAGEMGRPGMGGGEMGPHYLRGLNLSDAQRDKVFEIMHRQAPLMRDKAKAQHKAAEDLRLLTASPDYSEAKVRVLADAVGKAVFEMTLAQTKLDRQIFELLTAEQRQRLAEMKPGGEAMRGSAEAVRGVSGEGRNPPPRWYFL